MSRLIVHFGVRNDKSRGILVETISENNVDFFYFPYHNQPMDRHSIQLQTAIRTANVKRAKKITVDITEYVHDYKHPVDNSFHFKGTKLLSNGQQFVNASSIIMNKEIGQKKRAKTIADNKEKKIAEQKAKLRQRMSELEQAFQAERIRRINEAFGVTDGTFPQNVQPGNSFRTLFNVFDADVDMK